MNAIASELLYSTFSIEYNNVLYEMISMLIVGIKSEFMDFSNFNWSRMYFIFNQIRINSYIRVYRYE